jgi:hypothetical protein
LPGQGPDLGELRLPPAGGPRARRAVPSRATERRAREVPVCPPGQSRGGTQQRLFEQPASNRVMVLSAVCPI